MRRLSYVILLPLLFIFFGCSKPVFLSQDDILEKTGLHFIPTQEEYPEDDGVVLYETHNVELSLTSNYNLYTVETVYKSTKLFKNIEDYATVKIHLMGDDKIRSVDARTIKPDGTIIELKSEDFLETSGSVSSYYANDERTINFTFPGIEKNCIIEYSYTMERGNPFMFDVWIIQDELPKIKNNYILTLPALLITPENAGGAGWDWNYSVSNTYLPPPTALKNTNPNVSKVDQSVTFEWSTDNVPAFEYEPLMPAPFELIQKVKFAPSDWKEWNELSKWYVNKILKNKIITDGIVKTKAEELTLTSVNEKSKIKALYDYVKKLRYYSVNLKYGGIVPHSPEVVLNNEYGDCKDKSILLISMLRSVGIKAEPVLVITADDGVLSQNFTSWSFNHMIVKVTTDDNRRLWLDPTSTYSPMGDIPADDEGIAVLVLKDNGTSSIENTPESFATDNRTTINIKLSYDMFPKAIYDIEMIYTGEDNTFARNFFYDKTEKDIKEYCKKMLANFSLNGEYTNCKVSYLDGDTAATMLKFSLVVNEGAEMHDDIAMITADPFGLYTNLKWMAKDERVHPVRFDYPYSIIKHIEVKIPENKAVLRAILSNTQISEKGLNYERNYYLNDNKNLVIDERLVVTKKVIEVNDFKYMKKNFEKIKNKSSENLIYNLKK